MPLPTRINTPRPRSQGLHCRIGDNYYRLIAIPNDDPLSVKTAPLQPPRIDTGQNPEDFRPEFGDFYSISDFSGGEGLDFAHRPDGTDRDAKRFWQSLNINVEEAEPGHVSTARMLFGQRQLFHPSGEDPMTNILVEPHTTINLNDLLPTTFIAKFMQFNKYYEVGELDEIPEKSGFAFGSTLGQTVEETAWPDTDGVATSITELSGDLYAARLEGTQPGVAQRTSAGVWSDWSNFVAQSVWTVAKRIVGSNDSFELWEVGSVDSSTLIHTLRDTVLQVFEVSNFIAAIDKAGWIYFFTLNTDTNTIEIVSEQRLSVQSLEQAKVCFQVAAVIPGTNVIFYTASMETDAYLMQSEVTDQGTLTNTTVIAKAMLGSPISATNLNVYFTSQDPHITLWRYNLSTGARVREHDLRDGSNVNYLSFNTNGYATKSPGINQTMEDCHIVILPEAGDWRPASRLCFFNQGGTGVNSFGLYLETTGILTFEWGDGVSTFSAQSTVAISDYPNLDKQWIRVRFDGVSGGDRRIEFYSSITGLFWEQIGDTVIQTGNSSIALDGSDFFLGAKSDLTEKLGDTFHKIWIRDSISNFQSAQPTLEQDFRNLPWEENDDDTVSNDGWSLNNGATIEINSTSQTRMKQIVIHTSLPDIVLLVTQDKSFSGAHKGHSGAVSRIQFRRRSTSDNIKTYTTGYLITPLIDHFTSADKVWATALFDRTILGGSIDVYYSTDFNAINDRNHNSWTLLTSLNSSPNNDNSTEYEIGARSRYITFKFEFINDGFKNNVPLILRSFTIRSFPGPGEVVLTLPINTSDQIEIPGRKRINLPGLGNKVYNSLKDIEGTRVEVELFDPFERIKGTVDSVSSRVLLPNTRGSNTLGSIVVVRGNRMTIGADETITQDATLNNSPTFFQPVVS